jgi:hypothetical protein
LLHLEWLLWTRQSTRVHRLLWIVQACGRQDYSHKQHTWAGYKGITIPCENLDALFHPYKDQLWNLHPNSKGLWNHWTNENPGWLVPCANYSRLLMKQRSKVMGCNSWPDNQSACWDSHQGWLCFYVHHHGLDLKARILLMTI